MSAAIFLTTFFDLCRDTVRALANAPRRHGIALALTLGGPALVLAADAGSSPVIVHYVQRPPYMTPSNDGLAGLTGAPTVMAFKRANVPFVLAETPFARQMHMLESNSGQDCMIGMFKKPERELFAKFTQPVYQDRAQVILTASANAHRFAKYSSVTDVFNDKSMRLLVKLRYSYGVALDALIERYQPTINKTADENLLMLKAIKLQMDDYMFIAPEEAAVAIAAAGFSESDFAQIKFKNMPDGEHRRIMCSKNVPDEVIAKLNAAIKVGK
ncbi:MAG: transporter substrate-binding domain-containing protein [Rhodocyclaceae bacterium]|jgi:polar amino acid transport system substrate-binding protein|nr:transporter substrate-binding domain-containing protein [Rhodocyclaceae bacterium]